ncbi:MAG: metalloregulator ArsR/SmtB family transcription factor [Bacteroidota bacterium]
METRLAINQEKLTESSEILRALAHPLRMKILEFIDQNDEINVNKIYNTLRLEQSITSQHLRILRLAGLVETERNGKYIYYSINYDRIYNASIAINNFEARNKELGIGEEEE